MEDLSRQQNQVLEREVSGEFDSKTSPTWSAGSNSRNQMPTFPNLRLQDDRENRYLSLYNEYLLVKRASEDFRRAERADKKD